MYAYKFREDLDVERCKQLIFWANIGFTNQMLEDIRNSEINELDYDKIIAKLDDYFNELKKIFYIKTNYMKSSEI